LFLETTYLLNYNTNTDQFFVLLFLYLYYIRSLLIGGSNCDQDSLLYRCVDTDSGIGRATPPRRAPSPSGPGSLPARRKFDDAASESGGSDYSGPR